MGKYSTIHLKNIFQLCIIKIGETIIPHLLTRFSVKVVWGKQLYMRNNKPLFPIYISHLVNRKKLKAKNVTKIVVVKFEV